MKTTMNIDECIVAKASELTGIKDESTLVRMGLETLIAAESAKRLALLGGSQTALNQARRRRAKRPKRAV